MTKFNFKKDAKAICFVLSNIDADMPEFNDIEVHPIGIENDVAYCIDQYDTEDDDEIAYWSVFLHAVAGGMACIADCETKAGADQLAAWLCGLTLKGLGVAEDVVRILDVEHQSITNETKEYLLTCEETWRDQKLSEHIYNIFDILDDMMGEEPSTIVIKELEGLKGLIDAKHCSYVRITGWDR